MPLSSLFGKKPQLRAASAGESRLRESAQGLMTGQVAQQATGLRAAMSDDLLAGREGRRTQAMGMAGGELQQRLAGQPTTQGTALEHALTRARGLSRVIGGTAHEFDNQLLRDRVSFARAGRDRMGLGQAALGASASIEKGILDARRGRRASESARSRDMFGAIAGAGLRFGLQGPMNRGSLGERAAEPGGTGVDVSTQDTSFIRGAS
jgi:hypothetical protein